MKTQSLIILAACMAALFACSQSREPKEKAEAGTEAAEPATPFVSSSAAVANTQDSTRKFVRTADLKFKAKDVAAATYAIENIANQMGGFVVYSNMSSTVNNKSTVALSADSSLVSTYFTVVNALSLRVPNANLDTTLKSIASLVDYMDYRVIRGDDVSQQILSNKLTQKRFAKNEQRLVNAIDYRGRKLEETTDAEELLMNKEEQSDRAKLSNLSLEDQVNFSTVTLSIYQRQAVLRELVSNDKNIDGYVPGFGQRMLEALNSGLQVLEDILVFLAHIWGLILIAMVAYVLYRQVKRIKRQNAAFH